jgi:hypothetical protein
LTGGFVVAGTAPKRLLIRADGPALVAYGVTNPLSATALGIYDSGSNLLAYNSSWGVAGTVNPAYPAASAANVAAAAASVGAFSLANGSLDSAVVVTLAPGIYSATVKSANSAGASKLSTVLLEIYELP